jgi:secondary thiamine-phosphate synthase enzyme
MLNQQVKTRRKEEFINIDQLLEESLLKFDITNGWMILHVPHTTAALTINENGDPDVVNDLLKRLRFLAEDKAYRHFEGNSDAHLKSSLFGCQQLVPVVDGRISLGRWQSVWFCEFDGPRKRRLLISGIKE